MRVDSKFCVLHSVFPLIPIEFIYNNLFIEFAKKSLTSSSI